MLNTECAPGLPPVHAPGGGGGDLDDNDLVVAKGGEVPKSVVEVDWTEPGAKWLRSVEVLGDGGRGIDWRLDDLLSRLSRVG